MLRISVIEPIDRDAILRLEGRLVGPWVAELGDACERMLALDCKVTLDMRGVSFIDSAGLDLVHRLRQNAVVLAHCSPFLEEQLKLAVRD